MRYVFIGFIALALVVVVGMVWFRVAPSPADDWHVDPIAAPDPGKGNARVSPPDAPVFDETPASLMSRIDEIAMNEPRTSRLAGSVEEGRVTYIQRSRLWGFPDYVTVETMPAEGGGATLAIFSRQRFGSDDLGVNRARVDRWLATLGR